MRTGSVAALAASISGLFLASGAPVDALDLGQTRPKTYALSELAKDKWKPIAMGVKNEGGHIILLQQDKSDRWRVVVMSESTAKVTHEGNHLTIIKKHMPGMPASYTPQDWAAPRFQLVQHSNKSCMQLPDAFKRLEDQYDEREVVRGITSDGQYMLTFTAAQTTRSGWSFLLTDKKTGKTCTADEGTGFSFGKDSPGPSIVALIPH